MGIYELHVPTRIFKQIEYLKNIKAYILLMKDDIAFVVSSKDTIMVLTKHDIYDVDYVYSIVSPMMKLALYMTPPTGKIIIQLNEDTKQAKILHYDSDSRVPILVRKVLKHGTHPIMVDINSLNNMRSMSAEIDLGILADILSALPKIEVLFDKVHVERRIVNNEYYLVFTMKEDSILLSIKTPMDTDIGVGVDHYITIQQLMLLPEIQPRLFNADTRGNLYFYKDFDVKVMLMFKTR